MGSALGKSTMGKKVTIGICARNAEKTIKKTVDSLLQQDYPHGLMELIFVDDGSEDQTLSILEGYDFREFGVDARIFRERWKGLGKSRNIVVADARGDYIVWVDDDIVLERAFVRKQVEFMEKHSRVGLAGGRFGTLSEGNLYATLDNAEVMAKDHLYGKKARSKPIFAHAGMAGTILRVKAIREVKGFNPKIRGAGEDADIAHKIANAGWLIYPGNDALFYHKGKEKLIDVWNQNVWYGFSYYSLEIRTATTEALLSAVLYSHVAYKLLHDKRVFLLPLYYYFKKLGWLFGFVKGYLSQAKKRA